MTFRGMFSHRAENGPQFDNLGGPSSLIASRPILKCWAEYFSIHRGEFDITQTHQTGYGL